MGASSQKPIKIDGKLWDELDKWLQTDEAIKLGYHSKAQFVTEAVRELLKKYSKQTKSYEILSELFRKNKAEFKKSNIETFNDLMHYLDHNREILKITKPSKI